METVGAEDALAGTGVERELSIADDLSFEFRSMLYRQVTEAMTNIENHAAAVVAARDRWPGHLGLLALTERALLAGGWNKTLSEPGLGTTIEFWMPLAESKVAQ